MPTRKVDVMDLHNAVSAVAPIDGVARLAGGGVRVDYRPEATPGQIQAAGVVVSSWSWDAEVERELSLDDRLAAIEARLDNAARA